MFLPLVAWLATAGTPGAAGAQMGPSTDVRRSIAAGDVTAIFMLPPETVCGSETSTVLWTADGNSLVARHNTVDVSTKDLAALVAQTAEAPAAAQRIKQRQEILVWDLKSRKTRSVFAVPAEAGSIDFMQAVPGSDRVVFESSEQVRDAQGNYVGSNRSINLLTASTGAIVRLSFTSPADPMMDGYMVSPKRPLIAIIRLANDRKSKSVRFFGPEGRSSPELLLSPRVPFDFDANGMPGYLIPDPVAKGARPTFHFRKIDPVSARETELVALPPPAAETKPKLAETSAVAVATVAPANIATAPAIFLTVSGGKQEESGVVSTDGTEPILSPRKDAIAYKSQGSLMVRLLVPVPREAYDRARLAAEKSVALSNAKQVGLALMMYASDMDDMYPGQDVDIRSRLEPYTKNSKLFDNFSYTYGGGSLSSIERPAETTIGYVTGPGGRAMIYADGHVKWLPDAP